MQRVAHAAGARLPRDPAPDASLALLAEGYRFVGERCRRLGTDVFETRLLLRKAICAVGAEAAEVFYAPGRFTRKRALPPAAPLLLQDRRGVQRLDGPAHRHRKRLFTALMTPRALDRAADLLELHWRIAFEQRWRRARRVVLHGAAQEVLFETACRWAGVPYLRRDVRRRTRELAATIDTGALAPRGWRALVPGRLAGAWARALVDGARAGRLAAEPGTAFDEVVHHRDLDGRLLPRGVAGAELLNLIRPTIAVARWITFAALALHDHPAQLRALRGATDDEVGWFVEEVRRFFPFFPIVGGRALEPFEWRGHRFEKGAWMLLDLYGTNHDPRIWGDPERFRPERFRGRRVGAYELVPQGGGHPDTTHRCAGEALTVTLVKRAVRLLVEGPPFTVPRQDLRVSLSRMPALPASGFVIRPARAA